jgi:hypothetical protein
MSQYDLLSETKIGFNKLARELDVSPSTIWRWSLGGCRGVKLEAISIGHRRVTSREAFARFVEATNAARDSKPPSQSQTPKQRQQVIERAEQRARDLGI